ncbi:MAG: hemolysin III family protein [Pirellulales bacterium]
MNEYGIDSIAFLTEPVCVLTHTVGAVVFAILSISLIRRSWLSGGAKPPDVSRFVRVSSIAAFATSVVLSLAVSGIYHLSPFDSEPRAFWLKMDYVAIFLVIAGTCSPAFAILFRGGGRIAGLTLIWLAAATGIALKTFYSNLLPPSTIYLVFLGMGWCCAAATAVTWRRFGASFVESVILGGVAYTAGAVCQMAFQPTLVPGIIGPHEILHVAVLVGMGFHWRFIYQFADGRLPEPVPARSPAESRASAG